MGIISDVDDLPFRRFVCICMCIYIYICVLGPSLSSLFKAMVRRGTPSWNYFLGDWNYQHMTRTIFENGKHTQRNIQNYIDVCFKKWREL